VTILQQCKTCHDGQGTAGTPMGLMTFEDYHSPSHSNPAIQVFQDVGQRVHAAAPKTMPPTGTLSPADLAVIDSWVQLGGPDCGFTHTGPVGAGGATGSGGVTGGAGTPGVAGTPVTGSGGVVGGGGAPPVGGAAGAGTGGAPDTTDYSQYVSADGTYFIKPPPGTKPIGPDAKGADYCFNLTAHDGTAPLTATSPAFNVKASEFYHEFDYKVPYPATAYGLSTKPIINNKKVLHHWLLFHIQSDTGTDGNSIDEIGLQIGKELVSGWAPGGDPPEIPPGIGIELPKVGGFMTLEFHYFNTTGMAQPDESGVRICTTTQKPENVATLTWLGTEGINIPANAQGTASGTCTPGVQTGDIHLIYASPHMHQLGTHMKTVINRKAGGTEVVVDNPFAFSDQRAYTTPNIVHPGDTLTTTCTWMNNTAATVGFGTSTTAEMCYNFVYSYPAHALPNPFGGGIEGNSNMCLR
jgi:hypothetical protein